VLVSAITKTRDRSVPQPSMFRVITDPVFGADFTDWVLVQAIKWTPYADDHERRAHPDRRTLRMRLGDIRENWITSVTSGPWSKRFPGFANDRRLAAALGERDPLSVTAPTLVIHGTADRTVDVSHAESVARRIPGARLVAVDGAGHGYAPPHRQTVDSLLGEFLEEHWPPEDLD
jgi:pimeloyl-ACP methyl ester carboxylesterase